MEPNFDNATYKNWINTTENPYIFIKKKILTRNLKETTIFTFFNNKRPTPNSSYTYKISLKEDGISIYHGEHQTEYAQHYNINAHKIPKSHNQNSTNYTIYTLLDQGTIPRTW